MATEPAYSLVAEGLSCARGRRVLFEGIGFTVDAGEVLHVIGANGTGKTSLLRILAGLSEPVRGRVLWRGEPVHHGPARHRRELLFLGHANGIKMELSARENLRHHLALTGIAPSCGIDTVLDRLDLYGLEDAPTGTLSAGQRRRVALARLLLCPARLWILDEPFTSLDRTGAQLVESLIREHTGRGGLAVVTSHLPLALDGAHCTRLELLG